LPVGLAPNVSNSIFVTVDLPVWFKPKIKLLPWPNGIRRALCSLVDRIAISENLKLFI